MQYLATHNETGEVQTWDESKVRAEIIDTYQHDMGIVFDEGQTDEEIHDAVMTDDLADHLGPDGSFEGSTYSITRVATVTKS